MSMFDNLVLDEFTMLDEGKQADDYRARKAKEKDASKNAEDEYLKKRWKKSDEFDYNDKKNKDKEKYNAYNYTNSGHHVDHNLDTNKATYSIEPGSKMTKDNPNNSWKHPIKKYKGAKNDEKLSRDAQNIMYDEGPDENNRKALYAKRSYGSSEYDRKRAIDATKRHLRRHPKTESALMLIAGYESDFAY